MKVFKNNRRRITFDGDTVMLQSYCRSCSSFDCSFNEGYTRTKAEVRAILKAAASKRTFTVGCQTFRATTAAVAYARRWARRK